jgi:RNA polymerase sigma-70 factor, ECF subfamily
MRYDHTAVENVTVEDELWMVQRFEEHRDRMKAVASRMLGSSTEADDALQEAWLRFSRSEISEVENLGGWLTTVVSRVCLDILRARRRRPPSLESASAETPADQAVDADPEQEAVLADSVGLALMVVLDTLTPAERVALVLHDMFGVPFDDIGPVVGRNAAATRQLASRARRRVRGHDTPEQTDRLRQAAVVEAFLAAARAGDFQALLAVLDPEVVLRADETAAALGSPPLVRGADEVAGFLQRARGARAAMVDGAPGAVWAPGGRPRVVLRFTIDGDRVVEVDAMANPDDLGRTDLVIVDR